MRRFSKAFWFKGGLLAACVLASLGCGLMGAGSSHISLVVTGLPAEVRQKSVAYQAASGTDIQYAEAPAVIQSIALTVSGPGMDTLSYYYHTVPESITIEVPVGKAREFNLLVYPAADASSAVINYLGTATADLEPDATVTLILRMIANETKLVIPDYLGQRLVITDNMQGDGYIEKTSTSFSADLAAGEFNPWDVDFDAEGNTYISNHPLGSGNTIKPLIIKIYDLNTNDYSSCLTDYETSAMVTSLAVDRKQNYLYYIRNSALNLYDATTNTHASPSAPPAVDFRYVAVDKQSKVYLSGMSQATPVPVIQKYDIQYTSGSQAIGCNLISSRELTFVPADILVKDNYLLILSPLNPGSKVFKMDLALQSEPIPCGYEALGETYDTRKGYFYQPVLFIATRNRKIYLIDDYMENLPEANRIVSFANPDDWYGWVPLSTVTDQLPFSFYN